MDRHVTVTPGDSFRTTCIYDTKGKDDVTFGLASDQGMCISFLLYYPVNPALEKVRPC